MEAFLFFVLGLVFGSFLTSFTYRVPRGIDFFHGRSYCPKCRVKIPAWANIPLFSYLFLRGKCVRCKGKISIRYPLIELISGISFLYIYRTFVNCQTALSFLNTPFCTLGNESIFYLALVLVLFLVFFSIFIIDLEGQIIFDELVFSSFFLIFIFFIFKDNNLMYDNLFSGFFFASILLFLNLATKGKGMGLGDVKLAIPIAFFLGFSLSFYWLFLAFLTGGITGIILIMLGKAKLKQKIAFGPFLIFSFFVVLFFGNQLQAFFF